MTDVRASRSFLSPHTKSDLHLKKKKTVYFYIVFFPKQRYMYTNAL